MKWTRYPDQVLIKDDIPSKIELINSVHESSNLNYIVD